MPTIDDAAQAYIDAIDPAQRPLFDRVHELIVEVAPDAQVVISYQMPTYQLGSRRLYLAAWKHGVSLYGWDAERSAGFVERHPELSSGRGTIKIPTKLADTVTDDELRDLARAALGD